MPRPKPQSHAVEQSEIWPESATIETIKGDISSTIEELERIIEHWRFVKDGLSKYPPDAAFIVSYTGIKQIPTILSLTIRYA